MGQRKINLSTVFGGQYVGIREIADSICPTPPIWGLPAEKINGYAEALAGFVHAHTN